MNHDQSSLGAATPLKRSRLAALLCGAALTATAAHAQNARAPAAPADEGTSLGEVVVTARFRAENIQKTPLAITAISGDELAARNVVNVTDLSGQAPNLIINPAGAGFGPAAFASIRGIGLNDFSLAFEPGVAIYIDDVYQARPIGAAMELLDLERLEILRGPQGTLFGQNAIGGAIRLISKKPTGDGGGYIEGTLGNFNAREIRGSLDVAIIPDRLFARFSASSDMKDGYMKVYDFACAHPDLAGSIKAMTNSKSCRVGRQGDTNVQSGRAAFRFLPTQALEINLIGDYENQHQKQQADKLAVIATTGDDAGYTPIWNETVAVPLYGVPYDSRFVTGSPYSTYNNYYSAVTGLRYPNKNDVEQWGVSGTVDWKLAPNLTLKSVSAYRRYSSTFAVNSSGSPEAINMTFNHDPHRQFSQELTLSGTNGPLDWTAGVYYYHGKDADIGYAEVYPPDVLAFNFDDEQKQTNKAAFIHAVYHITDKLNLTAGIRYTDESKSISILRSAIATNELLFPVTSLSESDKKWSPMANLAYQWTPTLMTYAQVATGFRGGGFSPRPNDQTQIKAFGAETLTTYEAGFKSSWLERRLRLNGAVFYSVYKGIQLPSTYIDNNGIIATVTQNVGKAHMEGAELEVEARPIGGLMINASAGYLHYQNDNLGAATGVAGGPTLDSVPPRTPKVTASLGAQYLFVTPVGDVTPRLDLAYQSKVYFDAANTALGSQKGYALLNGRITWSPADRDWSVSVFGTNLTNKVYSTSALNIVSGFGTAELSIAPPREWGVTVRKTF